MTGSVDEAEPGDRDLRARLRERWQAAGILPRALAGLLGVLALAAVLALGALIAIGELDPFGSPAEVDITEVARVGGAEESGSDPFAYENERRTSFERGATAGFSHVLYALSPGGVLASAERTARWRDQVERSSDRYGVDPDLMEAIVFLESAGRPEVIAGDDPAAASGLAQIVASTGIDLLDMRIDLGRSRRIADRLTEIFLETARIDDRLSSGMTSAAKAPKLQRKRRRLEREDERLRTKRPGVDTRFDPQLALDGMGRYLEIARTRFGVTDLAVQSYHMGIGNLESVIDAYVSPGDTSGSTSEIVADNDLSYARIYFNSSPLSNPKTWKILSGFADDSLNYYWKVLASVRIMELYRADRDELERLIELHSNKATAEEVFHPPDETDVFEQPDDLEGAYDDGDLLAITSGRRAGFKVTRQLGELAEDLGVERSLYRGLRPEALATLAYMAGKVRAISGGGRLRVTSAVRDRAYQEALTGINIEATTEYSLHTTGYSFDILRRYSSGAQALAFQFVLDRMKALGVIDYAVEPRSIHITVSNRAKALVD